MSEKTLISAREIKQIELLLNPHKNHAELYRYHVFACKCCPTSLRPRAKEDFKVNPDHALIRVWLEGSDKPISAGIAVLFDSDPHSVELGSLFVSRVFRGFGFGQMLVDALVTKFNDDNHLGKHTDVRLTAKVRYGNPDPIPILNKSGFVVNEIIVSPTQGNKSYWSYEPERSRNTAARLYEMITKFNVTIEDDLFNALISTHSSVRVRR
jgi:GNAT superfamily N-acetyltransferase